MIINKAVAHLKCMIFVISMTNLIIDYDIFDENSYLKANVVNVKKILFKQLRP